MNISDKKFELAYWYQNYQFKKRIDALNKCAKTINLESDRNLFFTNAFNRKNYVHDYVPIIDSDSDITHTLNNGGTGIDIKKDYRSFVFDTMIETSATLKFSQMQRGENLIERKFSKAIDEVSAMTILNIISVMDSAAAGQPEQNLTYEGELTLQEIERLIRSVEAYDLPVDKVYMNSIDCISYQKLQAARDGKNVAYIGKIGDSAVYGSKVIPAGTVYCSSGKIGTIVDSKTECYPSIEYEKTELVWHLMKHFGITINKANAVGVLRPKA